MRLHEALILDTARLVVRVVAFLSRLFNLGEGSNLPGKLALKLFPDLLELMVPHFPKGWITITGTNGKTTTTKILVQLLADSGSSLVTNARGANLVTGIVTSILMARLPLHQPVWAEYAVFEIDEAVLARIFTLIRPRVLVVTNFSRDQLDRYGEVDANVNKIMELLRQADWDCRVVLNGNDPNIARIGTVVPAKRRSYFGIKGQAAAAGSGLLVEQDTATAVAASQDLPELTIWAEAVQTDYLNGSSFQLADGQTRLAIQLKLPGVFNILNALAAAAVALELQLKPAALAQGLGRVAPSYGRSERFSYQGRPVLLFLVKNPVGFNHIIQLLTQAPQAKRLLLLLNDLTADGRDVSWIWDVALENLWRVPGITEVISGGTRAGDMGLRVKYSEPPPVPLGVNYRMRQAFLELAGRLQSNEELIILANYTAMNQIRPFLLRVCR